MKKKLLFIENEILHFDQTAGAKTSYMYLNLLIEMGLSVTFIAADFKNSEPYSSHLRATGVKVLAGKWFQRLWKLWFQLFARQFDYVFCNRPQPTKKFIDYVKNYSKAKILYQCHDLHYLRLSRQFEIDGHRNTLKQSRNIEKLETEIITKSDVLLTFSQYEKDTIQKKLPGQYIEVVPLFFYDRLNPPVTDFSLRHGIVFVGGFNHQPNVDAVLWFAKEVLPEIRKCCPGLVFYIAGTHAPREIAGLTDHGIKVLGYISDEELAALYGRVRLVVVPLRFGAGVKGKTIEAIHHALPLVSTSIGIEGTGLEDIVFPTDSPKGFAGRVVTLYEDEPALIRYSSQLYDYAQKNLTKTAAKARVEQVLNTLDIV